MVDCKCREFGRIITGTRFCVAFWASLLAVGFIGAGIACGFVENSATADILAPVGVGVGGVFGIGAIVAGQKPGVSKSKTIVIPALLLASLIAIAVVSIYCSAVETTFQNPTYSKLLVVAVFSVPAIGFLTVTIVNGVNRDAHNHFYPLRKQAVEKRCRQYMKPEHINDEDTRNLIKLCADPTVGGLSLEDATSIVNNAQLKAQEDLHVPISEKEKQVDDLKRKWEKLGEACEVGMSPEARSEWNNIYYDAYYKYLGAKRELDILKKKSKQQASAGLGQSGRRLSSNDRVQQRLKDLLSK